MAGSGAEVANAFVALTVRMPGIQRDIATALGGSGVQSTLTGHGKTMGNVLSGAVGGALVLGVTKAMTAVTSAIDGAIRRVDTMNSFPKVMSNLGYSADDASASITKMSDGLAGLPTSLDTMAGSVQQLAPLTSSLDKATELSLAWNNALLAGGKSTELQKNALEQYVQMLAVGKVDMAAWRSMVTAMPGQMNQLSEAMLGAGAGSMDLFEALKNGTVSFDDLNDAVLKLNTEGTGAYASFQQQARSATDGIATSEANLNTAITRGLANLIQKFQPQIVASFGALTVAVNEAFKVTSGLVDWIGQNSEWLGPLVVGLTAAVVVFKAYTGAVALVQAAQLGYAAATYGATGATYANSVAAKLGAAAYAIQNSALVKNIALWWASNTAIASSTSLSLAQKAVMIAQNTWLGLVTAAQWAWNAAMSANPIGIVITAVAALVAGLVWFFTQTELGQEIWANFTRFLGEAWENIVNAVSTAATWLWESVISPVFEAIRGAFEAVGAAATWLYENAIKPVFDGIAAVVQWLWNTIIQPYITLWINIFRLIGAIAVWLYENAIKPAWEGIQSAISAAWTWLDQNVFQPFNRGMDLLGIVVKALWETYVVPAWRGIQDAIGAAWAWIDQHVFQPIGTALGWLGDLFTTLWQTYVVPVWQGIQDAIGAAWSWIDQYVFTPFKTGIDLIVQAFENAATLIGIAWEGIKAAAAAPVNFVLETVWNKGVVKFWNGVVTELGLTDMVLDEAPTISFATGGVLPGWSPGRDIHQFYSPTGGIINLSGGEAIMRPEFTKAVGGAAGVAALNAAARSGTLTQNFADGGVVGNITGFLSDVWETISNAAMLAKEFITDPAGAIEKHIVQGIIQPMLGTQSTMLAKAVGQLPINLVRGLVDNFVKAGQVEGGPFQGGKTLDRVLGLLGGFPELRITSTYRTPAEDLAVGGTGSTRHTRIEDPAVDVAGPIDAMNRFAIAAAQAGGWYQVLYNNIDYPGVTWWSGHSDHVHLAMANGGVVPRLYDQGGWLPHGGMAVNLSGRPERVLSPAESVAHERSGPLDLSEATLQRLADRLAPAIQSGTRALVKDAMWRQSKGLAW